MAGNETKGGNPEISVERKTKSSRISNASPSYIISDIMTKIMSQPMISCISLLVDLHALQRPQAKKNWEKTRQIEKERDIMQMGLPRELCCRNCSARSTHAPAAVRYGPTTFLPGHLSLRYPSNGSKKELIRGGR